MAGSLCLRALKENFRNELMARLNAALQQKGSLLRITKPRAVFQMQSRKQRS